MEVELEKKGKREGNSWRRRRKEEGIEEGSGVGIEEEEGGK